MAFGPITFFLSTKNPAASPAAFGQFQGHLSLQFKLSPLPLSSTCGERKCPDVLGYGNPDTRNAVSSGYPHHHFWRRRTSPVEGRRIPSSRSYFVRPEIFSAYCSNYKRYIAPGFAFPYPLGESRWHKKTHDELRSASFDRMWSNIEKTKHPRVFIHCTLNRHNWQDVDFVARLVQKTPTLKGMTVQFSYPYNQGEENLTLSPEERRTVILKLLELKKWGILFWIHQPDWKQWWIISGLAMTTFWSMLIRMEQLLMAVMSKTAVQWTAVSVVLHPLPRPPAPWISFRDPYMRDGGCF